MKRKLDFGVTFLLIVLGIGHTVLAPLFYSEFNMDYLWFTGTGLGFVFLGCLNLSRVMTNQGIINTMTSLCNLLALIFICCFIWLEGSLAPQGLLSLIVLLMLLLFSLTSLARPVKSTSK
ncbi:hypothetical protein KJ966_31015 [bacterium]|nr:hypothetical protein [bacterium]